MPNKTILILYAEIMPYNVVTFNTLLEKYSEYELHVVSWGKDKKLTKYQQPPHDKINYYDKSHLNYSQLVVLYRTVNPRLILISGRMEQDYLKLALVAKKENKIVVGTSDNHYTGNIKQKIAVLFSNFLYKRYFEYMLVPGIYQYEYQRRLGYAKNKIIFPQYCANTTLFEQSFIQDNTSNKEGILFLGRLHPIKGIEMLVEVHKELYDSKKIKDKLIVIGDGILKGKLNLSNDHLEYHSFMAQDEIIKIMTSVKYFCLPSKSEPWGVVIHEAAAAGLPIVTTSICGAATAFVKQGYNGYLFESENRKELELVLLKMNNKTTEEISQMGKRSFELSKQIHPEMWVESIINLIE
ncbi:MAG: glycosyltransferase family 4 protein [Flavobacteriales bacterium]|nr:glycosyltransferase family 4 protein [Flavobacteriales bacterium]